MKTKLVYVLTCSSDSNYIEQALMAVYSARHWNPEAYIILITDNLTDQLLIGQRAAILDYISEKIVISFDDDSVSMFYRSRELKTTIRNIISGDYLFIDSDTITQKSLSDIDNFNSELGGVYDSHLKVSDYCESLFNHSQQRTKLLGVDLNEEQQYFCSGVLYVKDVPSTHKLYYLWNTYWRESYSLNLFADQPALAKANREIGHIIQLIPDTYNCLMHVQPIFAEEAQILHFSSYKNPSYLFTKRVLTFIKTNGIDNEWIKESILNPCTTYLPFDYLILHSNIKQRRSWINGLTKSFSGYRLYIDPSFEDFPMNSRLRGVVVRKLQKGHIRSGIIWWMLWKRLHLLIKHKSVSDNTCKKKQQGIYG